MTTETIASLVAFRKRIFGSVSTKTIAALSEKPELASRVANISENILARDSKYWLEFFVPKTDSADSTAIKSEVVILEALGPISEEDADSIRDAMDA